MTEHPAEHTICKGAWALGSACGKYQRCLDEARSYIPMLRRENNKMEKALAGIFACLPGGVLLSNNFKGACFDEARRLREEYEAEKN